MNIEVGLCPNLDRVAQNLFLLFALQLELISLSFKFSLDRISFHSQARSFSKQKTTNPHFSVIGV